jgi:hypothetical protein
VPVRHGGRGSPAAPDGARPAVTKAAIGRCWCVRSLWQAEGAAASVGLQVGVTWLPAFRRPQKASDRSAEVLTGPSEDRRRAPQCRRKLPG